MVRATALIALTLTAAVVWGPATSAKESKSERIMKEQFLRTPEQIMPLVKVKGDALDPDIEVSTYGVTVTHSQGWLMSAKGEYSFLRAFINKKTGDATAQVYHIARYGGSSWNFYTRATYEGLDGLVEAKADRAGSDVDCGRYGCTFYEDIVFQLPLSFIEEVARRPDPSNLNAALKYRLFAQSGVTIDDGIPINELVAFARKVVEVRASVAKEGGNASAHLVATAPE